MGRSVQRVINVLAALRLVEVVRYDTDGKRNRYGSSIRMRPKVFSPLFPAS
ncbi:MAG TPA: hypothetical protein VN952_02510 [Chthoniobacterales bacterium]|nr:hypothetical protein [Chthoniobacterales bacterium]